LAAICRDLFEVLLQPLLVGLRKRVRNLRAANILVWHSAPSCVGHSPEMVCHSDLPHSLRTICKVQPSYKKRVWRTESSGWNVVVKYRI